MMNSDNFPKFMDTLAIGLLALAALLTGVLLLTRNNRPSLRDDVDLKIPPRKGEKAVNQQMHLDLDQQTRFVENPKRKQYRLLNDAEQELYRRLQEAMPNMVIFAQVGVAQLAQLRGRREARSLIQMAGRGVDFVVCGNDFAIIAAIELAWPKTSNEKNVSENEKRQALQTLGIPLIVFRPNSLPDAEAISREIADAIVRRNRLEAARR
jgi:hypothetical protein